MSRSYWHGDKVIRSTAENGARALFAGADYVLAKGNETVPYLEGILAASGHASVDQSQMIGIISYDTPYAVKQHEDITLRHTGRRRARWLVLTLQEQAHQVRQLMADQLRRSF